MPLREYVAVQGSERSPLPGSRLIRRASGHRVIEVTVVLKPSARTKELAIAEPSITALPKERHYLTREEFAAIHGADRTDVRAVARFARAQGLSVAGRNLAARTLHLRGRIRDFSRAFRVPLYVYWHRTGYYRGRLGPVKVPTDLKDIVQGVFGLDNRPQSKPHFRRRWTLGGAWAHAASTSYFPTEIAKLYEFPTTATGKGQCIGIVELGGGYRLSDLRSYFTNLGLRIPQITWVSVNGGRNAPSGPNGPDGEVMLDIEVAAAVAPNAKIVVYFAPNTSQGFLRAITRAVHDRVNRPSVVSISWGGPEASWTAQSLQAMDGAMKAAASLGVTVCCAAGDGGSSDGVAGRRPHADFPASSPHALACGGTRLDSDKVTIKDEVVWNEGPGGGATGGGVSDFFAIPDWQAGAGVPPTLNPSGFKGRGLPDVSGDADPETGYLISVDGTSGVIGGTSAVAPLWAGLIALLNETLGTPVGFLNPLIYKSGGKGFRDITAGDNDMTGQVGGYNAKNGWDACTGLGSPAGSALLSFLQGS